MIDPCLRDEATRRQTVQYFVEDFVRYHRDMWSLRYVKDELIHRIGQYLDVVREVSAEVPRVQHTDDDKLAEPMRQMRLRGMIRAIAGYAQFIDLWNTGGITSVVAAYRDNAYVLLGRACVSNLSYALVLSLLTLYVVRCSVNQAEFNANFKFNEFSFERL